MAATRKLELRTEHFQRGWIVSCPLANWSWGQDDTKAGARSRCLRDVADTFWEFDDIAQRGMLSAYLGGVLERMKKSLAPSRS